MAPTESAIWRKRVKVDDPGIGAAAGDDHFGLVLGGEARQFVVIDDLVFAADSVGDDLVGLAGEVERMAVGEVSAVREIHAEDGVAGLEDRGVGGLIGLRTGVGLHVGVLGVEELFGAVAGEVLDDVGEFAAAVVALAGVAFGVLVGEDAAGGFEDGFGGEIFAGDQFEAGVLAIGFVLNCVVDVGVDNGKGTGHPVLFVHQF